MDENHNTIFSAMPEPTLHMIGAGFCGTVWAASTSGSAYKREDGGPFRSLENDFNMHRRVIQSIQEFSRFHQARYAITPQVQVPDCDRFIPATDRAWWESNLRSFPQGYTACNILQSQRIPHFHEVTRRLLTERYCPPQRVDDIMRSEPNKDCLIRPYLGRRRVRRQSQTSSQFRGFSLRNFPLHADQMEDLNIPPEYREHYARIMARTLAVMHWIGHIDGSDIEFVLALPNSGKKRDIDVFSNVLGEHSVWVLDFNCCRDMSIDEEGVRRAVTAFWCNDPFYPRPVMDPTLWDAFRSEYLQSSEAALGLFNHAEAEQKRPLLQLFVDLIEHEAYQKYGPQQNHAKED